MAAFGPKLRLATGGKYIHWCPGCKMAHGIDFDDKDYDD